MTLFLDKFLKADVKRVVFFALIILFFASLTACGDDEVSNSDEAQQQTQVNSSEPSDEIPTNPEEMAGVEPPAVAPEREDAVQVDNSETSVSEQSDTDTLSAVSPDVPVGEPVDDEFFSDAAFMGNSLMDGFRLFSGLTTCDYYAATSMTVVGADSNATIVLDNGNAGTLVDALCQKPYGKIYILLGINEIGYQVETFIDLYGKMLDKIIAAQPECDIYIMGLTPVSAAKSASSDTFNMTRITTYNEALRQLAEDKGIWYLDLVEALAGPDGYLPSDVTTDGIHFSASEYAVWLDYVKTHYV